MDFELIQKVLRKKGSVFCVPVKRCFDRAALSFRCSHSHVAVVVVVVVAMTLKGFTAQT